jgi:hypothetical protein
MDPNQTLAELRSTIADWQHHPDPERVAELFEALDLWLASDGFLPTDWKKD